MGKGRHCRLQAAAIRDLYKAIVVGVNHRLCRAGLACHRKVAASAWDSFAIPSTYRSFAVDMACYKRKSHDVL